MNKIIVKKMKNRYWFNSYRKFKQKMKELDKDYEESLESLKRPKTEEEKYWDEFWKDLIG